ncbi:hypothetical protein [Rugamonas aquatica]|uniref:Uncharacterized protein n=1 Tax=Rugamonas aquatica TaxID=2743357 RepID=A0A6A7N786_9BURK|nr:hypothetical protein [Rugamonas aquatica]MQA40657.1 hypothetical protein [Rugamonas aquatica]
MKFVLDAAIGARAAGYAFRDAACVFPDCPPAIVAFKHEPDPVYLLIDESAGEHKPRSTPKAVCMLESAVAITKLLLTMVVPMDAPYPPTAVRWSGRSRGPFVVYRFAVVDAASSIHHG